jgi:K+-transporting ATPase KdpF subunit
MGPLPWLAPNLGLISLTVIAIALIAYLLYAMVHPEKF